jgi:hypothetical protein
MLNTSSYSAIQLDVTKLHATETLTCNNMQQSDQNTATHIRS